MRGRVLQLPCAVAGRGYEASVRRDDDCSNGNLRACAGSLGFRGLTTAVGDVSGSVSRDAVSASLPFLFEMMFVSAAIVGGLLMAGVLLPPPLDVDPGSRVKTAVPPAATR